MLRNVVEKHTWMVKWAQRSMAIMERKKEKIKRASPKTRDCTQSHFFLSFFFFFYYPQATFSLVPFHSLTLLPFIPPFYPPIPALLLDFLLLLSLLHKKTQYKIKDFLTYQLWIILWLIFDFPSCLDWVEKKERKQDNGKLMTISPCLGSTRCTVDHTDLWYTYVFYVVFHKTILLKLPPWLIYF